MHSIVIDTYAFLACFASGYMLAGRRPILTLSTRLTLVALFALALGFVTDHSRWHEIIGAATIAANVAFIAFAAIDYVAWVRGTNRR